MDGSASTTAAALMEMVNILGMSPRCLCPQLFSFALSGRLARASICMLIQKHEKSVAIQKSIGIRFSAMLDVRCLHDPMLVLTLDRN